MKRLLILTAFSFPAFSDGNENELRYHVTLGGGYSFNTGIEQAEINQKLNDLNYLTEVGDYDDSTAGYSAWVGVQLLESLVIEAGYVNFGEVTLSAIDVGGNFKSDTAELMPTVGEGYSLALRPIVDITRDISLYGRIGAMNWNSETSVGDYTLVQSGTDLLVGAGAIYSITPNWALSLSWDSVEMVDTRNHLLGLNISYSFTSTELANILPTIGSESSQEKMSVSHSYDSDSPQVVKNGSSTRVLEQITPSETSVEVYFPVDSALPKMLESSKIEALLSQIDEDSKVSIIASTDMDGSELYNKELAKRRAQFMLEYLMSKGVERDKIDKEAIGEIDGEPKADYRRVTIAIVKKE